MVSYSRWKIKSTKASNIYPTVPVVRFINDIYDFQFAVSIFSHLILQLTGGKLVINVPPEGKIKIKSDQQLNNYRDTN